MDERHRAQRVVNAIRAVRERVLDRQNEARRELSERTTGVHERRRVGLEPTLGHEPVELLRDRRYSPLARSVSPIAFGDDGGDAPEHVFWRLDRLARLILHQVALLENRSRIL